MIYEVINKHMLDDKDPEKIREILDIAENQGIDIDDAEKVKEIMEDEDLEEDEATEFLDLL